MSWRGDLIEGGHTSDSRHLEKLAEKKSQRHTLMDASALRRFDAKLMIFAFGVGGTIYQQSSEDMRQLGTAIITKTLKEVHMHSVTCVANIIT